MFSVRKPLPVPSFFWSTAVQNEVFGVWCVQRPNMQIRPVFDLLAPVFPTLLMRHEFGIRGILRRKCNDCFNRHKIGKDKCAKGAHAVSNCRDLGNAKLIAVPNNQRQYCLCYAGRVHPAACFVCDKEHMVLAAGAGGSDKFRRRNTVPIATNTSK